MNLYLTSNLEPSAQQRFQVGKGNRAANLTQVFRAKRLLKK